MKKIALAAFSATALLALSACGDAAEEATDEAAAATDEAEAAADEAAGAEPAADEPAE